MNTTKKHTKPTAAPRGGNPDRRQVKKKKESTLDPKLFVKKAQPSGQEGFRTEKSFEGLGLSNKLLQNILAKGYQTLTNIQEQSILPLLDGRDMMAISKTGSGKTAAYLLPILERYVRLRKTSGATIGCLRYLVLQPSRELAAQCHSMLASLSKYLTRANGDGFTSLPVFGGSSIR